MSSFRPEPGQSSVSPPSSGPRSQHDSPYFDDNRESGGTKKGRSCSFRGRSERLEDHPPGPVGLWQVGLHAAAQPRAATLRAHTASARRARCHRARRARSRSAISRPAALACSRSSANASSSTYTGNRAMSATAIPPRREGGRRKGARTPLPSSGARRSARGSPRSRSQVSAPRCRRRCARRRCSPPRCRARSGGHLHRCLLPVMECSTAGVGVAPAAASPPRPERPAAHPVSPAKHRTKPEETLCLAFRCTPTGTLRPSPQPPPQP